MRLADSDLLPYDFTGLADTIHRYIDELQKLLKTKQDEVIERNKEIEEGVFTATADPKKTSVPPPVEEVPPHLNFAPLQNAWDALTRSAERYQKALEKVTKNGELKVSPASRQAINSQLLQNERKLTSAEGLPRRPWFQHLIYAPGAYTGYGVKTIPGVREAIEQKKWKEAEEQIVRAANALKDEATLVDSVAQKLEKGQ
jgi:N-acetylated-alpha-linked acidic dipeptidase